MGGFLKLSARTRFNNTVSSSPPLEFKRITTTASTDSSTASYDAVAITSSPNPSGSPGRKCPKHDRSSQQEGGGATSAAAAAPDGKQQEHRRHTRQRGWEQHQDQLHRGIISHPSANNRRKSSVSFGEVTVREYCRSIGDWWDIPNGLGLGWEYYELPSVSIPDEDQEETRRYIAKLRRDRVKKFKSKVKAMLLVNRNKLHSNGMIRAESITGLDTSAKDLEKMARKKSKKNRSLNFDDKPCTSTKRKQVLIDFGYDSTELAKCESERQRLRFEYNMWMTRTKKKSVSTSTSSPPSSSDECGGPGDGSGSIGDDKPSQLLIDRVLADIRYSVPSSTTTTATNTAATSATNVTTVTTSSGDTTTDNYCYCI
jgi:hypothetical protein